MLMLRMREFADRKSKNWKCTKKCAGRGKWHWRVVALQMASISAALSPPSALANVRNWCFCAQLWLWIYFTSLCNKFLHTIDFCFRFDRKTPSSKEKSPVTFDELQELVKKLAKYIATQMHSKLFLGNNVDQLVFFAGHWVHEESGISRCGHHLLSSSSATSQIPGNERCGARGEDGHLQAPHELQGVVSAAVRQWRRLHWGGAGVVYCNHLLPCWQLGCQWSSVARNPRKYCVSEDASLDSSPRRGRARRFQLQSHRRRLPAVWPRAHRRWRPKDEAGAAAGAARAQVEFVHARVRGPRWRKPPRTSCTPNRTMMSCRLPNPRVGGGRGAEAGNLILAIF